MRNLKSAVVLAALFFFAACRDGGSGGGASGGAMRIILNTETPRPTIDVIGVPAAAPRFPACLKFPIDGFELPVLPRVGP